MCVQVWRAIQRVELFVRATEAFLCDPANIARLVSEP